MLPDHVVQLAGVQLESVEEVAQAERAGHTGGIYDMSPSVWGGPMRGSNLDL